MKKFVSLILAMLCCLSCAVCFASCEEEESTDNANKNTDIYYVKCGTVKIELGADAADVLGNLGTPKDIKELGDCGGFGAQVKYVYDNFDLYTVKSDTAETVDQISFTSDIAVTPKGICISSSKDEVLNAYGEPTLQNEKEIRYTSGQKILKFGLKEGNVSSIDYIRVLS